MSWKDLKQKESSFQTVKCVVIGDTAVGKTRLICARACGSFLTLRQMFLTHVPTVWAIDQYALHREVMKRSLMTVDGVNVSLRLWDTFGDHEKDRKYAFQRSSVILLCFSISSPASFEHCRTKWYHEIRRFCPNIPIVLVGCKNDLRHIHRDERYKELCKEKNLHIRKIPEHELISREQGREMAAEIGAVEYYEASAITRYGVTSIFENIARVALIARRKDTIWNNKLQNVSAPLVQEPYCPPKPMMPNAFEAPPSTFINDISSLQDKEYAMDGILKIGDEEYRACRIILASLSPYFQKVFSSFGTKICTVDVPELEALSSDAVQKILRFLHTGEFDFKTLGTEECSDIRKCADILEIKIHHGQLDTQGQVTPTLRHIFWPEGSPSPPHSKHAIDEEMYPSGLELIYGLGKEDFEVQSSVIKANYCAKLREGLKKIGLQEKVFTDTEFEVDDGRCHAHRCILMARCEMMHAMFSGNFRESTTEIITFPGVSKETFDICLQYLYTDSIEDCINIFNGLPVIELANRLCLPRLMKLVEADMIYDFKLNEYVIDASDVAVRLYEPSQIHNADKLADYCQYYIITHYKDISFNSPNLLNCLQPENQAYLLENRWPPEIVLKEQEIYEKWASEQALLVKREEGIIGWKKTKRKVRSWLQSKKKKDESETEALVVRDID